MNRPRPVVWRASFKAASTLSVPDCAKKLIAGSFMGDSALSFSASLTWPSCQ